MARRPKPSGRSGPIAIGEQGATWESFPFPKDQVEREEMVARLVVSASTSWIETESQPKIVPFESPRQNTEADLDFTIGTTAGDMLMELTEFAPLERVKGGYEAAPLSLPTDQKAEAALDLVRRKSDRQGGGGRILVIYVTEQGFWLDSATIELMRRKFVDAPPNFERVYFISVHDFENASLSEIYPGMPHHSFGKMESNAVRAETPHPLELLGVREKQSDRPATPTGRSDDWKCQASSRGDSD